MFFVLSKVLNFVLNPLNWILILLIISVFHRYRRLFYLRLSLLTFIIFSNPILSNIAFRGLEVNPTTFNQKADVAVILTGMLDLEDNIPGQVDFYSAADRFTEAVKLYHLGKVNKIMISGGSGSIYDNSIKEAILLGELAAIYKVDPGDLVLETNSRNTFENAKFSAPILNKIAKGEILLITSAFHMRRARACFEKQGIDVIPYPVDFNANPMELRQHQWWLPSTEAFGNWKKIIKEILGMIAYRVAGYI